jgi:hypothetical protein
VLPAAAIKGNLTTDYRISRIQRYRRDAFNPWNPCNPWSDFPQFEYKFKVCLRPRATGPWGFKETIPLVTMKNATTAAPNDLARDPFVKLAMQMFDATLLHELPAEKAGPARGKTRPTSRSRRGRDEQADPSGDARQGELKF